MYHLRISRRSSWFVFHSRLHTLKDTNRSKQQLLFIIEFVYIFCQWLIKMSFLTFYMRVLSSTATYRKILYFVMAFTSAQTIGVLLFYGLQCRPLGAFFNPQDFPDAICLPTPITLYFPASLVSLTFPIHPPTPPDVCRFLMLCLL